MTFIYFRFVYLLILTFFIETHASNIPLSPREFAQDSKRLKENNKAVFQSPMSNSKKLELKTSSGKKIEKEKSKVIFSFSHLSQFL